MTEDHRGEHGNECKDCRVYRREVGDLRKRERLTLAQAVRLLPKLRAVDELRVKTKRKLELLDELAGSLVAEARGDARPAS